MNRKASDSRLVPVTAEKARMDNLVLCITFYMIVSLSIVFINRALFMKMMPAVIFVTWYQTLVSFVLSLLMGWLGSRIKALSFWPQYRFDPEVALGLLPLSVAFVGMISMNNICLQNVTVSTYQVARSSTIIFNLLMSYFLLHLTVTVHSCMGCFLVAMGLCVGALDGSNLSPVGLLTGTLGSAFWALYSILIKKKLVVLGGDHFALLNYNLTISLALFVPLIFLFGELPLIQQMPFDFSESSTWQVWGCLTVSGTFGFLMNIAVFLLIKATSPLTFNILGTIKATIQTMGGFAIFGEVATIQSISGIILCLGGSAWYTFGQNKAKKEEANDNDTVRPSSKEFQEIEQHDVSTAETEDEELILKNGGSVESA